MKTQIEGFKFQDLFKTTTVAGWVLLARPVIYLLFSRRRDLNDYNAVDFSSIMFIFYSVVAFIVGYRTIFKSENNFGRDVLLRSPILWFMLYSGLCLMSMLWSVDVALTGFRTFECVAMTLLIVAVIQQLFEFADLKYVILWSLFYCTWDVTFGLIRGAQWAPDLTTLLQQSQMMATTFFFMALYFIPLKWYNYLIIIMSIFSMSTVAYIGMALGSISAFWKKGQTKFFVVLCAVALVVTVLAIGPYKVLKDTVFFDKEDISIKETSGRDYLMEITLKTMEEDPMGLGFFAGEPYVLYRHHFGAISAHNSLFSAVMGMGLPGVILISIFFVAVGYAVFSKYQNDKYKPMLIGCFCVAFLHCMGNPSVGTRVFGAWMPCMYMFVLISSFYVLGKNYSIQDNSYSEEFK